MKFGITFSLKPSHTDNPQLPDDAYEEFDSPDTIDAIANVLRGMGHSVVLLGDGREFLEKVLADKPDFVFNFAEGHGVSRSREARVPAVLEMLDIPYTGSDPFTLAVTLDKDCAKTIVRDAGVAVPAGFALEPDAPASSIPLDKLAFPVVVKPAWEGSSKGIHNKCLVQRSSELANVVASLRQTYAQTVLIEEYIAGDELTVGIYGNRDPQVLGIMRVVPNNADKPFIYSIEVKRNWKALVSYQCPVPMSDATRVRIESDARTCFRVLGCRDVARVDFRLRDGVPYFLEVNPLPGLNPITSDLGLIAKHMGWSYEQLVSTIVIEAIERVSSERRS